MSTVEHGFIPLVVTVHPTNVGVVPVIRTIHRRIRAAAIRLSRGHTDKLNELILTRVAVSKVVNKVRGQLVFFHITGKVAISIQLMREHITDARRCTTRTIHLVKHRGEILCLRRIDVRRQVRTVLHFLQSHFTAARTLSARHGLVSLPINQRPVGIIIVFIIHPLGSVNLHYLSRRQ